MLYFAYAGLMEPDRLAKIAPKARFQFIAHLPETRLCFPLAEGLPSVVADPGHTVWGAVFEVNSAEGAAIAEAEAAEGRQPAGLQAVDREGNKYEVVTYIHPAEDDGDNPPSTDYMERVVRGARHWGLPTGWIVGLEEYGEDYVV
jgi:gamma-glutamylcyclotransferase (GGCT)/AIG2-like uncharacterized protein YtfP